MQPLFSPFCPWPFRPSLRALPHAGFGQQLVGDLVHEGLRVDRKREFLCRVEHDRVVRQAAGARVPEEHQVVEGVGHGPLRALTFGQDWFLWSRSIETASITGGLTYVGEADDFEGYERTIDSHVKNLRAKLDDDPRDPKFIYTVHGVGYRFESPKNDA